MKSCQLEFTTSGISFKQNPNCLLGNKAGHNCYGKRSTYDSLYCGYPNLEKHIADVKGYGFKNVVAKKVQLPFFTTYIPIFSPGSGNFVKEILKHRRLYTIGVSLGNIVNGEGEITLKDPRRSLGINDGTKLVLFSNAHDSKIEKIWTKRHDFFASLKDLGFDLVTAIDYSVWGDQSSVEQRFNLKRSLITFEILQKLDIPTIPHVYFVPHNEDSIDDWVKWLEDNTQVSTISMYLGTIRKDPEFWNETMRQLQLFSKKLSRPLKFIVGGIFQEDKIKDLKNILGDFYLTGARCYMAAMVHENIDGEKYGWGREKVEMFNNNCNHITSRISQRETYKLPKFGSQQKTVSESHYKFGTTFYTESVREEKDNTS